MINFDKNLMIVTSPGFLWVFGTRQRTKCGSQLCRVDCDIKEIKYSDTKQKIYHQLGERDEVDGRHRLAATTLLLLLALVLRCGGLRKR